MIRYFIFITLNLCIFFNLNLNQSYAENNNQGNLKIFTGNWKDKCFEKNQNIKKYCLLERGMFLDEKLEKRIVQMIFRISEDTDDIFLTIISPLGTLIPKGFNISLDTKQLNDKPYGFSHCTQNGCFSRIRIDMEKVAIFKKSKSLNLEYILPNQQPLDISINLKGFTKAFEKITKF